MIKTKKNIEEDLPDLGRLRGAIQQLLGDCATKSETLKVLKEVALVMLTERELGKLWGIKVGTLRNWRSSKTGPHYVKIGGSIRYPLLELASYANQNIVNKENRNDWRH